MRRSRLPIIMLALALAATLTMACGSKGGGATPTDALKAYIDAASKKDVAAMKSHLSQGTLKLMEDGAKAMNKNLDDMLKDESGQMPPEAANIKYSNEKVNGDTASVDMTAQGQTATMPLVKENGEWKLALDKFIQDMKSKMGG
jgi:predicted Rossmann fold nucleotide-binding protein DprA/Smf involved in DNA uptake